MEFQVTLANAREKLMGRSRERRFPRAYGDEEAAVCDDLQTVGMIHGVIGDKKDF